MDLKRYQIWFMLGGPGAHLGAVVDHELRNGILATNPAKERFQRPIGTLLKHFNTFNGSKIEFSVQAKSNLVTLRSNPQNENIKTSRASS